MAERVKKDSGGAEQRGQPPNFSGLPPDEALVLAEFCNSGARLSELQKQILENQGGEVTVAQKGIAEALLAEMDSQFNNSPTLGIMLLKNYRHRHPEFLMVLPEDIMTTFGVSSVGIITPPPRELITILDSDCVLWPGKKVRDTHFLSYLPTHLGAEAFNLLLLHEKGTEVFRQREDADKLFWQSKTEIWWPNQPFANESPTKGEWLLLPQDVLPGTLDLTYANQQPIVDKYPNYQTAKALEHVSALILTDLVHKQRYFKRNWGFCEDLAIADSTKNISAGLLVLSGNFVPDGLDVDWSGAVNWVDALGRAVRFILPF